MHTHKLAKRVQEGQPRFSEPSLRPRTKQEKVLRGVFLDFLPHQRRQGPSISSNCSEVFQTAVFPLTGKQGRKQAPSPASRSLSQEGGIQAGAAWAEQYTPFALSSVHCSSVTQSCMTLCDPMNRSTPGLPVHHQLPEFTQTHVHRVSDAIQPSHPRSSPSPPAPNPSQHQSLFQ